MTLKNRIDLFAALGQSMQNLSGNERERLYSAAANQNPWFTTTNLNLAWEGILRFLQADRLDGWMSNYSAKPSTPKAVGVVMAGNIPMVGFHDMLSVLLSGHRLRAKLSSQDSILIKYLIGELVALEPLMKDMISIEERLNGVDAMIATGSDNTARYFEYYFRNIPHIIRKNRSSCAVLTGSETSTELQQLGLDIFSYFGLGCRNVSKLFVPEAYDLARLPEHWLAHSSVAHHHKYANNYDYNKSIFLINKVPFFDTGYVLITESTELVSPISVLYYEHYKSENDLKERVERNREKLQCITSAKGQFPGSVEMGKAQFPGLSDYADNVDTMSFLTSL